MIKHYYTKLRLQVCIIRLIALANLLLLISIPEPAYAQWPPFNFDMEPAYANGRITYQVKFSSNFDGLMTDITFKVPLPKGTRFVEASALPTTRVDFDGMEVTFFTALSHKTIKDAYFIVEVTDPTIAVFTTHAWIAWKGYQGGDYLTEDVSIDITKKPLNWERPPRSRVEVTAGATIADNIATYIIYPTKVTNQRIWDLKVSVPLPASTTFLSAEAPAPFVANFDGREVSFSLIEMEPKAEIEPLKFHISTEQAATPFVVTHVWTTWKNVGAKVGEKILAQENSSTGDIVMQPHTFQQMVADTVGDVPFSSYDLTTITLQEEEAALKVTFHTTGDVGPVEEPLHYIFYIDSDCLVDTGKPQNGRGLEYRITYRHNKDQVDISLWEENTFDTDIIEEEDEAEVEESVDETEAAAEVQVEAEEKQGSWEDLDSIEVSHTVGERMVVMWIPTSLLGDDRQFCWLAEAVDRTKDFASRPPVDRVPNGKDLRLTQYQLLGAATEALATK